MKGLFSLGNLYLAYRKAKAEAFYENTHFHALEFTKYEQNLHENLIKLEKRLTSKSPDWMADLLFLGDYAYLPKSVDSSGWDSDSDGHFRALAPCDDWRRNFETSGSVEAVAALRLVMRPTVDFQIVSALWVMKVGHLFDGVVDKRTSFGNRLRRGGGAKDPRIDAPGVNASTPGLFAPYFSAYREWRERGLNAMDSSLKNGESILAITMDIAQFYHRVSPKFLLRPSFLSAIGLTLEGWERTFTQSLLGAIDTWYRSTPDFEKRPEGAIPVGLSASKVIANVLMASFDRAVSEQVKPIYYGRYVDDIFLVMQAENADQAAANVTERIVGLMKPLLSIKRNGSGPSSIKLSLPFAKDSELIFAGPKQKIFALSSAHGSDLVHHIRDQIRIQSSEYRLLSSVPTSGVAMASRALLAAPNATLQVDALRKADVVSVRRLGLSLLLSDIETYAADLRPETWQELRTEFYDLVDRHVITPVGFFEFFGYIHRVFGLMLACGDMAEARGLVKSVKKVADLLAATTTLGQPNWVESFSLCLEQYAMALLQAGLQAATARSIELGPGYLGALRSLRTLSDRIRVPRTVGALQKLVKQVLLSDWGRRPYKEYWFLEQDVDEKGPAVPRDLSVKRQLRLGAIRRFRENATDLKVPHWPALAFSTRPMRVDEIALVAPKVLSDVDLYKNAIKLLRGARVTSDAPFGYIQTEADDGLSRFETPGRPRQLIRVAVTSVETTEAQWTSAVKNKHDRSLSRYMAFNGLMNRVLKEPKRPDYIVMPELCVPLRWALRAARKLALNGVSLLAGVEYRRDRATKRIRNDCLVSLTTRWPGYAGNVVVLQPKFAPAHGEREQLFKITKKKDGNFYFPVGAGSRPTVYGHSGFYFSALVCSDLTNVTHRHRLRGEIDALFALEWNPDTKTFASLVESTANDLHAFVIQTNNRKYGDSRVRAPAKEDYNRDVVQVKGGVSDYYVLGEVDYAQLRREQRRQTAKPKFKPIPIGYVPSKNRKVIK